METVCVVPAELSLVLRGEPARSLLEMTVTVWTNRALTPGHTFHPDQGRARLHKLEVYSLLHNKDVRHRFGSFDELHEVDGAEVRHCNWVRFVHSSVNLDEVNLVAMRVRGRVLFQVVRPVPPNTELLVFFDESNDVEPEMRETVIKSDKFNQDPTSVSRLLTPTSDREDDCPSTTSDVTSASDDSLHTPKGELSSPPLPPMPGSADRSLLLASPQSPPSDVTASPPSFTTPPSCFTSPQSELTTPPSTLTSPDTEPSPAGRAPARRNRERTWLPCDVCGKKFDRPSLLRRHMRTHTGEKPHACDVCGKAFSTSSSLNTHRRIHSGEKPHECQVCGKRFTASSNLYYHRMTHNKEKPHKCTLCSKSFPTPGDLKSHMYVHNGSWPFKCDICSRGFSKQTNLKNHLLLHTGDKPHECQLCGKRFALQCNLKTHMKTHEGDPQEECHECGKVSLVSSNQVVRGFCRPCLRHVTPRSPYAFHVTSPSRPHRPEAIRGHVAHALPGVHMPTSAMTGVPPGGFAASYAARATYDPAVMMPLGRHAVNTASPLLQYGPGMSWPKLVPPQY